MLDTLCIKHVCNGKSVKTEAQQMCTVAFCISAVVVGS